LEIEERIEEIERRIKDIEDILVDVINGREANPELQRKLEKRTGKERKISYREVSNE